jgi:predicted RNA binding protein YcfA (HicA-like mRNA interferase family)
MTPYCPCISRRIAVRIDYRRIRNVTARELIGPLLQDGFFLRRQRGSHQRYQHPDGRRVASSDTFRIGTLQNMVEKQALWTQEDLERLKLAK